MKIGVTSAILHSSGNSPQRNNLRKRQLSFGARTEAVFRKNIGKQPDGSTPPFGSRSNRCRSTSRSLKAMPQNAGLGWQVSGNSTMSRDCLLSNHVLNNSAFPAGSETRAPPCEQRGGISDSAPNTWPFSVRHQALAGAQSSRFRRQSAE